jgi:membrane dipeptidase
MNSIKKWLAGLAGLLLLAFCASVVAQNVEVSPKAREIHDSAIVIDTHADTPQRFLDENFDIGSVTTVSKGNIDLQKAQEGNLGAEFFSIWVAPDIYKGHFVKRTFDLIDAVYEQAARHPDQMMMAFSAEDIVEARSGRQKKLATLMGIEGGHSIEGDIRLLRDYYLLGVRYMTLTWSNTNEIGDSSGDLDKKEVKHHNGLTPFGKQVVLEMNRLGMMVDISHVADKTFWDTLAVTKAPLIASHSSARALSQAARNMTDDMLRAVAKNGGVVDVNFYSGFVDDKFRQAEQAQKPARDKAIAAALQARRDKGLPVNYMDEDRIQREWITKIPRPPLSALIDQIDHVAKVAGIDHVGLGSDFDGVSGALPAGMDSVADLPKITQGLLDRGYTPEQIEKILGGNVLRVFREVERVSRQMRGQP